MDTDTATLRQAIRTAARAIEQAQADAANLADRQPVDFAVGDHIAQARQHLAAALAAL